MSKSRKKKILAAIAITALLTPAIAYAFTFYLTASNTFTVGSTFSIGQAYLDYNGATASSFCTAGTFPSYTCPVNPATTTIFSGDVLTYQSTIETDQTGVTAQASVTAGTFTSFSVAYFYQTVNGATTECLKGNACTGLTSGLPTMTPGTWYSVFAEITISSGAPLGSTTFQFDLGR